VRAVEVVSHTTPNGGTQFAICSAAGFGFKPSVKMVPPFFRQHRSVKW
jgi:hypothetical protein